MTTRRFDHEGNPIGEESSEPLAASQTEETLEALLRRTESELQGHYPMMVDSVTRLDSVSTDEDHLHYQYSLLNAAVEDLDVDATRTALVPMVQEQTNNLSFLKLLMDKGATISFHYQDKQGNEILTINVKDGEAR